MKANVARQHARRHMLPHTSPHARPVQQRPPVLCAPSSPNLAHSCPSSPPFSAPPGPFSCQVTVHPCHSPPPLFLCPCQPIGPSPLPPAGPLPHTHLELVQGGHGKLRIARSVQAQHRRAPQLGNVRGLPRQHTCWATSTCMRAGSVGKQAVARKGHPRARGWGACRGEACRRPEGDRGGGRGGRGRSCMMA